MRNSNNLIENSYSTSFVSGSSYIYGMGSSSNANKSTIVRNSYFGGTITSLNSNYESGLSTDAITIENSFYNKDVANLKTDNEYGKTTKQMMLQETFIDWDFENIWSIDEGQSNPYLGEKRESIKGTIINPFVIKTAEELQNINDNLNACYVLENDIDLSGVIWTPIGNAANKFIGSFDGKGHTISNLTGDFAQPNVGVFGVATNSVIKNVNLKDINITNTNRNTTTGALIGIAQNNTIIEKCTIVGGEIKSVNGSYIGSLVGDIQQSTMKNCYASNKVTGYNHVGGLVGLIRNYNNLIENSYSTSFVSGTSYIYGIGSPYSTNKSTIVRNSYFGGTITSLNPTYESGLTSNAITVENSFYNKEIANSKIDNDYGKTTKEMMLQQTFVDWDFENIWSIDEGQSNPYLGEKRESIKGTIINPFVIKTAEELQNINDNLNACYVLENDIDLTGVIWTPIGNAANKFIGSFDGKGYTISNLTGEYVQQNIGVFGVVNNSVIKNIKLKNINIINENHVMGALVGRGENNTIIENCIVVDGKLEATSKNNIVGSLVGDLVASTMRNCYGSNKVIGNEQIGGLVGRLHANSLIENSYSTSYVSGFMNTYGISSVYYSNKSTIIKNSYFGGTITSLNPTYEGGLSTDVITIENSFYNKDVANLKTDNEYGKTTKQMMLQQTFVDWDFENVWSIDEGQSNPHLGEKRENVKGTIINPIVIKTAEELQNVNDNLNASYVLGNDIDLTGVIWTPIGNAANKFIGSFDGKGYTISNLTGEYVQQNIGVFGVVNNSVIKNIKLKNINIINKNHVMGALVGRGENNTIIENCIVVDGKLEATSKNNIVGSLVGDLVASTMRNCYGSNKVIGNEQIGGLVGRLHANSLIENSYSTSYVSGYMNTYGISSVYYSDKSTIIRNSYFAGIITSLNPTYEGGLSTDAITIENSFYNKDVANLKTDNEYGKTTKEMMSQETFTDWDFENIWHIDEAISYPVLRDVKNDDKPTEPDVEENKYIEEVLEPKDAIITSNNEIIISTNLNEIVLNLKVYEGSTWKLFSDLNLSSEIIDKKIILSNEINTVYVVIYTSLGEEKTFKTIINKSEIDPSIPNTTGRVKYEYDKVGRLVKVTYESGNIITYEYDKAGNILKISKY